MTRIPTSIRNAVARRPYACAFAAATLVSSFTLAFGFFIDDYLMLMTIDGRTPITRWWSLFEFGAGSVEANQAMLDWGPMPWWALEDLKIRFFRPLASALMTLDRRVFGDWAVGYHAHSMLWYLLFCGAAAAIFRRAALGVGAGLGALALLVFVVDEAHWLPMAWWSNRNAIVAAAPALWGVVAHLRWREDGWRPGLPLSVLGLGMGLAGGETAVGALGYLIAYEAVGRSRDAWQRRAAALAPAMLGLAIYLAIYKGLGFGVRGSGVYFDPIGEFGLYLWHAPERTLMLFAAMFLNAPVEPVILLPSLTWPLALLGLPALAILGVAIFRAWPALPEDVRRHTRWLALGGLLSLPPVLATFASSRLLVLPSVAGAWLLGLALWGLWRRVHTSATHRGDRVLLRGLVAVHLLIAPLLWIGATLAVRQVDAIALRAMDWQETEGVAVAGRDVVVLCVYDPIMGTYPLLKRQFLGHADPHTWRSLSFAMADHRVKRIGPKSLELEIIDGELMAHAIEYLIRSPAHPIAEGTVFLTDGMRVTVLACGDHGPRHMRFDFDDDLDHPRYVWLTWRDGQHRPVALPAPGESLLLPRQPSLFEPGGRSRVKQGA